MEKTANPRVKICCISSIEEAWIAIRCGASALGLVSQMPSGPGVISEELIAKIAACVPPPIATFLLTSSQDAQEIIQQVKRCRTNTVQICDRLESGSYQDIRDALPGISIVQVIHVITEKSIDETINVAPYVDAILLDSGNQSLLIKELGGTGRLHDWNLSAQIREQVNVPIFLAGGLKSENVAIAVKQVAPFGLDLCSAVRSNGKLDENKLKLFFEQLKYCTEELSPEFN
ncbi:phosphoribosylanthranilate isomerase [Nostoc sp. ChiVER01]|uniref:phosphoribosylanthranilate isomerase n=1 Tax=Nostoc sp. ChiVER01 TaxID=3075382 RepID=UPI002AD2FE28|nr:phosphoribosylanthranilate isomerase [Nostoc sp. ChiVER01]MDZ8225965.1 phosphoribosylanthranilate isomerase [Nostoc sp. ChiVER01]